MKNKSFIQMMKGAILLSALFFSLTSFGQKPALAQANKFRVKFNQELSNQLDIFQKNPVKKTANGIIVTGIEAIDKLNETYQVRNMKRVFTEGGKFEQRHRKAELHLWYEIEVDSSKGIDIKTCIAEYKKDKSINICELIYNKVLYDQGPLSVMNDSVNDPRIGQQWHYHNIGQTGGLAGADIQLYDAWKIESGSDDVIVAVIDGGIDNTHEDLAGAMWVNSAEKNGRQGIDDDSNGYIDDINGYGFGDGLGVYSKDNHGTHVGGTIGAISNNQIGVAGIAGGNGVSKGVRLMSCATFGANNSDGFDDAFIYAADNGAVIAQNSWGYSGPNYFEQSVLDAIDYFIENAGYDENGVPFGPMQGGLVIFAAGNENSNANYYPAYYEHVLSVAATNHTNQKAWYSNYGQWVDIAAPGGETSITSQGVLSTLPYSSYGFYQGTSMACPHVSGVAALIVSKYGGSGLTPDIVWNRLTQNVDNIDSYNPNFVNLLGTGKLNAYKALEVNDSIPPSAINNLRIIDSAANSVILRWTASGCSADSGTASNYELRYANFQINAQNFNQAKKVKDISKPHLAGTQETFEVKNLRAESTYWFALAVSDYFGNKSGISNVVTSSTKDAPIFSITPNRIVCSVDSAEEIVITAQIHNEGSLPLQFEMPKFAQVSGTTAKIADTQREYKPLQKGEPDLTMGEPVLSNSGNDGPNGFGYSWKDNKSGDGPTFNWIDISSTGTSASSGDDSFSSANIPFAFPFYGQDKRVAYISTNGFITFNSTGANSYSNQILPSLFYPNDLIALMWDDLYASSGAIKYYGDNNKFIVQYTNVSGGGSNYKAQIILYPNGNIKLQYLTVNQSYYSSTVGIENATGNDGLNIAFNTNYLSSNLAILITPKPCFITGVTPSWGTVAAHSTENINIALNSNELLPDNYIDSIAITTNDLLDSIDYLPVLLHVNGEPKIALDTNHFDFGDVFVNQHDSVKLVISNPGTDTLSITSLNFKNGLFNIASHNNPIKLYKNDSISLWICFNPTSELSYKDTLIISNNAQSSPVEVIVQGDGLYPPVFASSPNSFNFEMNEGDSVTNQLIINNANGRSNLNYQIRLLNANNSKQIKDDEIGFFADETRPAGKSLPEFEKTSDLFGQNNTLDTLKNFPSGNSGIVIIGLYAYITDYTNSRIVKYNLTSQSIESSFTVVYNPYGLAYDGTYLWTGNSSGNIYGYSLDGQSMGSFSAPSYSYNAITYNGTNLVVCSAFSINPTFYTVSKRGSIISSINSLLSNLSQISSITDEPNEYYVINSNYIYKVANVDGVLLINDTIEFEYQPNAYAYSIFYDNVNNVIWFAYFSNGQLYKLEASDSNWISLSSNSGTIQAGNSETIDLSIKTKKMVAGFYYKDIYITSNDPTHSGTHIPVQLILHGDAKINSSADTVLFDSTYVGITYLNSVIISNVGTDTLKINRISSTSGDFSVNETDIIILPKTNHRLDIYFTPSARGTRKSELLIPCNDQSNLLFKIFLTGYAEMPPVANLSKDSISVDLFAGQTVNQAIELKNTGGSQLVYSMSIEYTSGIDSSSVKSDEMIPLSEGDFTTLPTGNHYTTSLVVDPNTGFIYAQIQYNTMFVYYNPKTQIWDTLAQCPIYTNNNGTAIYLDGKIYTFNSNVNNIGIYDIASNSWTTMPSQLGYTSSVASGDGLIYIWYYNNLKSFNPLTLEWKSLANSTDYTYGNGNISYFEGNLYANSGSGYQNFLKYNIANNQWESLPSMPLSSRSGSAVDSFDKKIYKLSSYNLMIYNILTGEWLTQPIPNFYASSASIVYNPKLGYHGIYFNRGSSYLGFLRYETTIPYRWIELNNNNVDTLMPDESKNIDFKINSRSLLQGNYGANIHVWNNNPSGPDKIIAVNLNIKDAANITLSRDSILFNNTFKGFDRTDSIEVFNYGNQVLKLDTVYCKSSIFKIRTSKPTVDPQKSTWINITANPSDTGYFETDLIIKSNAQPQNMVQLKLGVKCIEAPVMTFPVPEPIVYVMPGKSITKSFVIRNQGGSALHATMYDADTTYFEAISTKYINSSGVDTDHSFSITGYNYDTLKLNVTLNGNYSDYEYAELEIEGTNYGIINALSGYYYGVDINRKYSFDKRVFTDWLADGKIDIKIINSVGVDVGYGSDKNVVELIMMGTDWVHIESNSYVIEPNDSIITPLKMSATDLAVGDYKSSFLIRSNDPAKKSLNVPVTMKVRNQEAPFVNNPIADQKHYITEKVILVDISKVFFDVNDDSLIYSVTSGNIEQLFASVIDNKFLKLELLNTGSSLITLSARDGNFNPVSTSFSVLILSNGAPVIVNQISDTVLYVDSNGLSLVLNNIFTDPDNDLLKYSVECNDTLTAKFKLEGYNLKIWPLQKGIAKFSVSADDNKGGVVVDSFNVDFIENQAPIVIGEVDNMQVYITQKSIPIDVRPLFQDPDNDKITLTVASGDSNIAVPVLTDGILKIEYMKTGSAHISIMACDSINDLVETGFDLTIVDNSLPSITESIPDQLMNLLDTSLSIDLNRYFYDADGDSITFVGSISDTLLADLVLVDSVLNIKPLVDGTSTIFVFATDGKGDSISSAFMLTIQDTLGIFSINKGNPIHIYPNPFNDKIIIDMHIEALRHIEMIIYDFQGKVVLSKDLGYHKGKLEKTVEGFNQLNQGIYYLQIKADEKTIGLEKIVKD